MIYTILSWIYITVLVYPVGLAFHKCLHRVCTSESKEQPHFIITCISGLLVMSFISSVICLFYPLGLISNVALLLFSVLMSFLFRKELVISIRSDIARLRSAKKITYLLFLLYLVVVSYLSYLPSSHHDDGLYYSTSIKWLQEYGTVKGLANLNPRIGYNSSWFVPQASFGFSFLNAGLFNDLNGLFYLWLFLHSLGGVSDFLKRNFSLSNSLKVLFFIPLLTVHLSAKSDYVFYNANQLSSSSPDIIVTILLWLIFLLFIEDIGKEKEQISLQSLLIIFYSTWVISIKLSSIPVILLSVFYIFNWVRKRKTKQAAGIAMLALLFLLPWFARNILLTGYLVFPFSRIDVFNVAWKIPIEHVRWHENAVKAYAVSSATDLNQPFHQSMVSWFPSWFGKQLFMQQAVLILTFIINVVFFITIVIQLLRKNFYFFKTNTGFFVLLATFFTGIIFWLMNGPDFRLGYGFLWPYCIFSIILFFKYFLEAHFRFIIYPVIIYMFFVPVFYYQGLLKKSVTAMMQPPVSLRMPEKIETRQMTNGQLIYLVFHDDSWNGHLPVANNNEFATLRPVLLGRSLREGFKTGETKKVK